MSVSLVIDKPSDELYLPVATESFFKTFWLDKSVKEGFELIPEFQTGFDVTTENVNEVIKELELFAVKIPAYIDVQDDVKQFWIERLNALLNALKARRSMIDLEAFIG